MAKWSILKAAIAESIKNNSNQEITGQVLQNVLNNIVSSVGENSTFAGIATPTTNPGVPDGNVFYLATEAGTYSNFNGIEIASGEVVILEWRERWTKKVTGFATQQHFSELDKKSAFAIDYKADNHTTRLQVLKSSRKTGKIISYRNPTSGELTVEMYIGTSMDDQYWQDDLFWANIFPSTKLPFINVTFITNKTYSSPDKAVNALPNTYYTKEGLIFSFKDNNNRYRSYLYLGQINNSKSYIPIDNYCFETLVYNTSVVNTRFQVDLIARKQGFTITYNDGTNQIIETYIGTLYDNSNWGKDYNWQRLLTYKDFDEILANSVNIYNTIAEFSINKVYGDLILSNKTIDGSGNIVNGNGVLIEKIDIPVGKEYVYTNAYSVSFYRDDDTLLSTINMGAPTGKNISKREIPSEASYCRAWNNSARDFYYLSFEENFIPVEFGIAEIPKIDYNKNLITENNLIKGYNNVNGSLQANESYNTTRFIPIDSNVKSIFSNAYSVGTYGEDGVWIKYTGSQANTFREIKIDNTPKYLVLNFSTSVNPFAFIFYFPCNNVDEIVNEALNRDRVIELAFKGKKFCSFGDSIVELSSWQKYIWKYFRMADHYIRGIGGSKVTSVNPQTKKVNEDGYYNASNPDSGTITISDYMCGDERVNTIPLDTDVLCVYASANDITASVEMGTLDDGDESHFMYAYGLMVRKIVKRLPKAKIFLCTPHNFYNSYSDADFPYKNNKELTILDYCKAIKDIGAIYGIPVIDVNALSTISTLTITKDLVDQVHPAPTGGKKIANVVISEMIRYVSMSLIEPVIEDVYH
nr:MAG TPA: hypothetical protein [Caudoviricetes sp.]